MNFTLRQLRYFQALARERHFGRAAASVSVTQPALSVQIRQLEANFGGALVERSVPGLPLTPLGRSILPGVEAILWESQGLEATARKAEGITVALRLGIIPTVAPYLVPPLLPLIRAEGGSLTVREAVTDTLLIELREGVLDAAVMALPVADDQIDALTLFEDLFLLALPPEHLTPRIEPVLGPDQIDPETLLLLDEGHCLSEQALGACGLRRNAGGRHFGAASLATLARLVASGQGVTLVPEIAADTDGRGTRLSRFAAPEPGRTIGLVRRDHGAAPAWFMSLAGLMREAAALIPRPDL